MRSLVLPIALGLATLACAPAQRVVENVQPAAGLALPFLEDDYARALEQARSRGVPLFVEAWAPW